MRCIEFSEDELIEVANCIVLTAFHAIDDENDDIDVWKVATRVCSIVEKIEQTFSLCESEEFMAHRELAVLRRRVKEQTG